MKNPQVQQHRANVVKIKTPMVAEVQPAIEKDFKIQH